MDLGGILEALGYDKSPNYLQGSQLDSTHGYSHIFRRAKERCSLSGVYVLAKSSSSSRSVVPAVYVCTAESVRRADIIHKRVWNQNVVPFLVVATPQEVRLYSGFSYADAQSASGEMPLDTGILETAVQFNSVADRLRSFHSSRIDDGSLWRDMGGKITPETRLDWQLLNSLKSLDQELQAKGASKNFAHSLIGKYVYLKYLRDRKILSNRKLDRWGVDRDSVFSRNASVAAFNKVLAELENWLNGSIFPLNLDPASPTDAEYLRMVAGRFVGDERSGQMYLNFLAYDFSYIPIETLSVIYEQFLHSTGTGRDVGAYYTPLPLVNFMLEELDERRQLKDGMKVLDPSCGSGAFLVQCYRRLIEREITSRGKVPRLERLRELLVGNIYGIDQDADACGVAELSLILTLLDYVTPPDLENKKDDDKLPCLRNSNILHTDFFDDLPWEQEGNRVEFKWIVGNPPWKEIDKRTIKPHEEAAVRWMEANGREYPVGRLQVAEAFAWRSTCLADPECLFALLLPAMTLFKTDAHRFRRAFFSRLDVWCIVNFANLRHMLFRDADQPAAAFFYSKCLDLKRKFSTNQTVVTYSPMLANQEAGRYAGAGRTKEMWAIVVNAGEIQHLPAYDAATGGSLAWKLAMWGTARDRRLIHVLSKNFPSLDKFIKDNGLDRKQGVQLRHESSREAKYYVEELVRKKNLNVNALKKYKHLFSFPVEAYGIIDEEWAYLRERGTNPLPACRPPHIVVSAAGRFSVFSDEFLAYPHPHIGISGRSEQTPLLKALSLFLSSHFATYYKFFSTPLWGVERDRLELKPLLKIPVPIGGLAEADLKLWAELHDLLAAIPPVPPPAAAKSRKQMRGPTLFPELEWRDDHAARELLLQQLNAMVYDALRITVSERSIVDDFVQSRMKLNDGQLGDEAIRTPTLREIADYCDVLRSELDAYTDAKPGAGHRAIVVYDGLSAMVKVYVPPLGAIGSGSRILRADEAEGREFSRIRSNLLAERGQWFYFNRSLRIYKGKDVFLFKPMQRMHWLKSQALADASLIVAESIKSDGG